jgi:hypothetical protein
VTLQEEDGMGEKLVVDMTEVELASVLAGKKFTSPLEVMVFELEEIQKAIGFAVKDLKAKKWEAAMVGLDTAADVIGGWVDRLDQKVEQPDSLDDDFQPR